MTNAEAVLECQREIRRLRGVVRENNEEINNLRIILGKAILYLRNAGKCDSEISELLGISEEEISDIMNVE